MQRVITIVRPASGAAVLLLTVSVLSACALAGNAQVPSAVLPVARGPEAKASTPVPAAMATAARADRLYLAGADQIDNDGTFVLDSVSGGVQLSLPRGYVSPDGSTLYTVAPGRDTTTVAAYDLATGRVLRDTTVAGLYDVPAMSEDPTAPAFSPDGRLLALVAQPTPTEQQLWNQTGKAPPTRMLVVDTFFKSPPRRVHLDGTFWFDTLGTDSLYLIEVLDNSAGHAPQYHVRRYDLATGKLDDYPVVDKREPGPMNGNRVTSVPSSDGAWLYSLYTRDAAGPFIHGLNLVDRYAVCIDLPFGAGKGGFESDLMWSLALSPDGKTLYVVNGALGQVAALDTESYAVRSAALPKPEASKPGLLARLGKLLVPSVEAKRLLHGGAAVSPDGQTLFAVEEEGFAVIATRDLSLQVRYMTGWPLSSLALSPDGAALYAVSAERHALLRLALPLGQKGPAPERIATAIRPSAIIRIARDR